MRCCQRRMAIGRRHLRNRRMPGAPHRRPNGQGGADFRVWMAGTRGVSSEAGAGPRARRSARGLQCHPPAAQAQHARVASMRTVPLLPIGDVGERRGGGRRRRTAGVGGSGLS